MGDRSNEMILAWIRAMEAAQPEYGPLLQRTVDEIGYPAIGSDGKIYTIKDRLDYWGAVGYVRGFAGSRVESMMYEVLGRDYPRCEEAGDEEGMSRALDKGKFYETLHGWIVGHEAQRLPMKVVPDWLAPFLTEDTPAPLPSSAGPAPEAEPAEVSAQPGMTGLVTPTDTRSDNGPVSADQQRRDQAERDERDRARAADQARERTRMAEEQMDAWRDEQERERAQLAEQERERVRIVVEQERRDQIQRADELVALARAKLQEAAELQIQPTRRRERLHAMLASSSPHATGMLMMGWLPPPPRSERPPAAPPAGLSPVDLTAWVEDAAWRDAWRDCGRDWATIQEAANRVTAAQHGVQAARESVVDYPYTGGWLAQRRYERAMETKNAAVAAAEQALRTAETAEVNARDAHTRAVEQQWATVLRIRWQTALNDAESRRQELAANETSIEGGSSAYST